jgi:hypothetical protein
MIDTQFSISAKPAVQRRPGAAGDAQAAPEATETFQPTMGFEPWIGPGKPGHPPASEPAPPTQRPIPAICPMPVAGIEPWQRGQLTDNPDVAPAYADKLTRTFGDQALLSIQDDRLKGCAGYYFEGWESVGGDDFIKGVTVGRLGDQWEMVEPGTYELKSGSVGQRLTFDVANRQTVLESHYDDNRFETSRYSEILRLDQDGTMRRENPPVGL